MISFANLLTLHSDIQTFAEYTVAPYVGAWIETFNGQYISQAHGSHPTWVRGLKHRRSAERDKVRYVAPYVGAWIETHQPCCLANLCWSHPTWVRGLKLIVKRFKLQSFMSHPTWVRGLKPVPTIDGADYVMSHPTWVRGLKLLLALKWSRRF